MLQVFVMALLNTYLFFSFGLLIRHLQLSTSKGVYYNKNLVSRFFFENVILQFSFRYATKLLHFKYTPYVPNKFEIFTIQWFVRSRSASNYFFLRSWLKFCLENAHCCGLQLAKFKKKMVKQSLVKQNT